MAPTAPSKRRACVSTRLRELPRRAKTAPRSFPVIRMNHYCCNALQQLTRTLSCRHLTVASMRSAGTSRRRFGSGSLRARNTNRIGRSPCQRCPRFPRCMTLPGREHRSTISFLPRLSVPTSRRTQKRIAPRCAVASSWTSPDFHPLRKRPLRSSPMSGAMPTRYSSIGC